MALRRRSGQVNKVDAEERHLPVVQRHAPEHDDRIRSSRSEQSGHLPRDRDHHTSALAGQDPHLGRDTNVELERTLRRDGRRNWDGTRATEDRIAAETKATIRCIPFGRKKEAGKCVLTGEPSE